MTTRISIFRITTLTLIAATLILAPPCEGTWNEDGTVICMAAGSVTDVRVVPDGFGGAILVWADDRSGTSQIYAQRVDSRGDYLWPFDGIAVSSFAGEQVEPDVVADGAGGAFVVWRDSRNGDTDIFGQYLDGEGIAQWPADGLPICTADDFQLACRAAADGFGGLVVAWQDSRWENDDIYAQRLDASGTPAWTADGLAVAGTGGIQRVPILAVIPGADEASTRVLIAWLDGRNFGTNGYDIYMQRMTLDGILQWGAYGVGAFALSLDDGDQIPKVIEPSIGGGFILSWEDYRYGPTKHDRVFGIHRFDRYGNHVGTPSLYAGYDPRFTPAPDGSFLGAFTRVLLTPHTYSTAYKQDETGAILWSQYLQSEGWESFLGGTDVVPDGYGGGVYCYFTPEGSFQHIYAQYIPSWSGVQAWGSRGLPICTDMATRSDLEMISLDDFSALLVWKDERHAPGNPADLYAQRLDISFETWGDPLAFIRAVEDEPADEGGWVRLRVRASDHDDFNSTGFTILGYSIWRLIETAQGEGEKAVTGPVCETLEEFEGLVEAGESTVGIRPGPGLADALGMKGYQYESLGYHGALGLDEYLFVVPTRADSTEAGIPWENYQVYVHGVDIQGAWGSNMATGYSVDNLAPALLTGLDGRVSWDPAGLDLTWGPCLAGDLGHYVVHRGFDPSFVPDGANRLATTTQTSHFDEGWDLGGGHHYKVAAVDRHGNVGPFALLEPDEVAAQDMPAVADQPVLMQNRPNPFNPRTTIRFTLPSRMAVNLEVYDMSGRLVDVVLKGEVLSRGIHQVDWPRADRRGRALPTGIYFYRLESVGYSETKRMVLVK
jgi:hypothetical protein